MGRNKKTNATNTDFVKIEPSPDTSHPFNEETGRSKISEQPDPVFTLDEEDRENTDKIKMEALAPHLKSEISKLKPQVEDISNMPRERTLSGQQVDILKKYISLKENEVRDLKDQLRQYQTALTKLSSQHQDLVRTHRTNLVELETLRQRDERASKEMSRLRKEHDNALQGIKRDFEVRVSSSDEYEHQIQDLVRKKEEWKDKVKEDLKKIKLKERELENKYELLKRDMQALLDSKDKHVLDLKKKNDALDFELESLEDRLRQANNVMSGVESRKRRLVETLKLALTLLEDLSADASDSSSSEEDPGKDK